MKILKLLCLAVLTTLFAPVDSQAKEYDDDADLVYFGHRYYTPTLGRWLTRDPIGERGGINLYRFVENDPIQNIDAYGLDSCKLIGPFLVVHPSPWKVWRPKEEIYWGTPELYEQVVGKVKLQNAIEAAGAALLLTGTAEGDGGGSGRKDARHDSYDKAIEAARKNVGDLGDKTIKEYDPKTGTLVGEKCKDEPRGWRIDPGHVNWWDWTKGKKGSGGKYGHEFYPDEQTGPASPKPSEK